MTDADREPNVSDEEILAVFARTDASALLSEDVADELPTTNDRIGDRVDDLYEQGLLDLGDDPRGEAYTLTEAGASRAPPDESTVETDVEAQAATTSSDAVPPAMQNDPSETPQSPSQEPLGDAYDLTDDVADAIDAFEPPGSSDQRRRRHEALRAAYGYLRRRGHVSREAFERDVFPEHAAGYDSPDDGWWDAVVEPGLSGLPDVEAPGGPDDEWRVVGDSVGERE
ncbi:hypothetical protein [Haloprofundus halobius]|uniref:hypothetical protein n=1 Tax=Haloprofundus halobius TaxID=2876194 RepID=UPI001CCD8FD8|nr:hypothetical protein [Haloprofundus halobius]